jgi:galactokinase
MHRRDEATAGSLMKRAESLLDERLGPSTEPARTSFAPGCLGLAAEHTRFFDGFALMLPMRYGIAVAVRRSAGQSRIVFDGHDELWTVDSSEESAREERPVPMPWWSRLAAIVIRVQTADEAAVDVAIASTIMPTCEDAYCAAQATALSDALRGLAGSSNGASSTDSVRRIIESCLGRPFSHAYLLATAAGISDSFVLVDTRTAEFLPVESPESDRLGWGVVETFAYRDDVAPLNQKRVSEISAIEDRLRKKAFPKLESLRDLYHQDLETAFAVLSRNQRPLLRHLVRENQRVQRLTVAARKQDWQFFGGLLLMSHASFRDDWGTSFAEVDFVVDRIEDMSVSGLYGGKLISDSGAVLLAGQPFTVPPFLDSTRAELDERFGPTANTVLL